MEKDGEDTIRELNVTLVKENIWGPTTCPGNNDERKDSDQCVSWDGWSKVSLKANSSSGASDICLLDRELKGH